MPSLLLVVVDCLRSDLVERRRAPWPRLERLAEESARFAAAYATCPTTTPSVTAMFTGRYPSAHGVRGLRGARLAPEVPTVAEELARAGLHTWCSLTGPLLETVGTARGFADTEYRDIPDRSVHSPWGARLVERVRGLEAAGEPWFGVVHVWDLHTPRTYPPRLDSRRHGANAYERALAGVDGWLGRLLDALAPDTVVVLTGDHGENTNLEPRSLRQQRMARRITSRLPVKELGQKVLRRGVTTDSKRLLRYAPRYFWNHGQTLHEPLVRVPLLVAGPGAATGVRETPVSHVDLAPTLLDLCDVPQPAAGWQGASLAPAVRGGGEPPARPIAMEVALAPNMPSVPQRAIRDGALKLITSFDDASVADALYDLEADPHERRNLAPARPDLVEPLRQKLRAIAEERAETVALDSAEEELLEARLRELGYL